MKKRIKSILKSSLLRSGVVGEYLFEVLRANREFAMRHPLALGKYARALRAAVLKDANPADVPLPEGAVLVSAASARSRDLMLQSRSAKRETMRRALLISHDMTINGAPLMLLVAAKTLIERGFEVAVWSMRNGGAAELFEDADIPVGIVNPSDLQRRPLRDVALGYDIAICNTIVCDGFVTLLEPKMPVLWYSHEADNLHEYVSNNERRKNALAQSRSLVAVSEYARERISDYNSSRIAVLHNGVFDIARLSPNHESVNDGLVKFLFIGSIYPIKGLDLLLKAFLSMPAAYREQARIMFVGSFHKEYPDYRNEILALIAKSESIEHLEPVRSDEAKAALFHEADVFVLPSRGDACPLVVLEAAMFSKPLIVSDRVGNKYMVENDNGIVMEAENTSALRDALMALIDRKDDLASMGERSRELYEERASLDVYGNDLVALIESRISEFEATDIWENAPGKFERIVNPDVRCDSDSF